MGLVWSVIWLILVADSPEEAKHISEKERIYIHSCLSGQTADHAKHVSRVRPFKRVINTAN